MNVYSDSRTNSIASGLFNEEVVKSQFDRPIPWLTMLMLRDLEAAKLLGYVKFHLAAAIEAVSEFRSYGFDDAEICAFTDACPQNASVELVLKLAVADIDSYMQLRQNKHDHSGALRILKEKKVPRLTVRNHGLAGFKWELRDIDWSKTSLKTAIKLALCAQHPSFKRVGAFDITPGNADTFLGELSCESPLALILFDYD